MADFVYRPSGRHNHLLAKKEQEGFAVFLANSNFAS